MKEKLLTLIDLELKNLDTLNLSFPSWIDKPAYLQTYRAEWVTGPKGIEKSEPKKGSYTYLNFDLTFADGKPEVKVKTNISWIDDKELIKKNWFKQSVYRQSSKVEVKYEIVCDHINVKLTQEEADTLRDKVSAAYDLLIKHKKEMKEKRTLEKIEARIAKHNEK
jgi:hypothetical protein